MQTILTRDDLKARIQQLQVETWEREQNLKDRWQETYESFKPQNLIRNVFSDAASTPEVRSGLISTSVGLLTGFLTRKLLVGPSAGIIKKLFGAAIQVGITKLVANKFPAIQEKAKDIWSKKHSHNGHVHYDYE